MKITKGKQERPQKVVIYGAEGIGKSTLAAKFPSPVFLDIEGGTAQLDVARVDDIANWTTLLSTVREFAKSNDLGKTLVIDTADWAEKMCIDTICKKFKKNGIEEFGYGKGYTYLQEEFANLLDAANDCIKNNKHVVLLAHAKMRKFEQPDEMGAYDRWELKLSKQVYPIVKEWADMVLFLNYQTYVVEDDNTKSKKAKGGKRVIYTSHHPCWDAKNRHGLPDELPLQWAPPLSDIFVETVGVELSQAVHTLGGEVTDNFGNKANVLSRAQVVEKLASNNDVDVRQIMLVLTKNEMAEPTITSLSDVDEEHLQTIIDYWEDFKAAAMQQNPNDFELPF